jgi:hypothetical protein
MESFFFTETTFHGLRFGEWKFLFTEQDRWFNGVRNQITTPLITRLDLDPFERFTRRADLTSGRRTGPGRSDRPPRLWDNCSPRSGTTRRGRPASISTWTPS